MTERDRPEPKLKMRQVPLERFPQPSPQDRGRKSQLANTCKGPISLPKGPWEKEDDEKEE